jgi:hypothetical protein
MRGENWHSSMKRLNQVLTTLVVPLILGIHFAGCATAPKAAGSSCPDCPAENHFLIVTENNSTSRIFLKGIIDGKNKRFFLDTGATRSTLVEDEQTTVYPPVGQYSFAGYGMTSQSCDWIKVDSFKLSGLSYSRTPFVRCGATQIGNTLGMDYFHSGVMLLDFEHARFSLRGPAPKNVQMHEMRKNINLNIELPISIGTYSEWAIFHTGSGMTIVNQDLVSAQPNLFKPVTVNVDGTSKEVNSPFVDSTGENADGKLYVLDQLKIGDVNLGPQLVTAVSFSKELKQHLQSSVVLGTNAMLGANWFFDLKKNLYSMTLIPANNSDLPKIQATADQFLRSDYGKLTLRGNAKISHEKFSLSAPEIFLEEISPSAKIAVCENDCDYDDGTRSVHAHSMKIEITLNSWKQISPP